MPLEMQSKLLRVLEEREFERIGGHEKIEVDVRVISETNEDLKTLVSEGKFREELYYRLDVVSLSIPPLKARHGDVPLLSQKILSDYCPISFSTEVTRWLESYRWPGNVRELRNVIESSMNMTEGEVINTRDLPKYLKDVLIIINEAIRRCHGNKTEAAKVLGLHRSVLYKKLNKLGIS